ncbi:MAG: DUF1700 domain-containing protein [Tissierellia bacterium]|nr:DUF1700 domain-containing protein [Tissierellia bacterium]
MNRDEFIKVLKEELKDLPPAEVEDILYDYEEHFEVGLSKRKTEEEIAKELGNPRTIAKSYKVNYKINNAEKNPSTKNIFSAILAAVSLGFFNLVFVLGPFIGLVGLLIGIYGMGFGLSITGIGLFFGTFLKPFFPNYIGLNLHPITSISFGIGFFALGLLILTGCFYLTKYLYQVTIRYLRWNINLITK